LGRFILAFILIALGVIFLLDNLIPGFSFPWGTLWPVILIVIGIALVVGSLVGRRRRVEETVALEGAQRARVRFAHGAGRLRASAGATGGPLLRGSFGGGVRVGRKREGDSLDVELRMGEGGWGHLMGSWGSGDLDWDVALTPDVPLELVFETGASETRVDLSSLRVSDLRLKTGASATDITLPAAGSTRVHVSSGAASVVLRVPSGVAARVAGTMGLGSLDVDSARFPRREGGYESPDFAEAANRVDIQVEGGVGSVVVRS
jgi:Domain of unknown function (DUF5668)